MDGEPFFVDYVNFSFFPSLLLTPKKYSGKITNDKKDKEAAMKKLYRNFIFDLTIAICALVLGIIMLPPFGIGVYALNTLLAATIVVYFLVYLWDKLGRTKGAIFLLTMTESVIYFFIVVDLIIQQFNVFEVLSVCRALGLVLWVRGTVSAVGMYITALSTSRRKSSLPNFLSRILLISLGMYLFAHPLFTNLVLNWAICIFFFISALAFGGLALLFSPSKK